MTEVRAYSVTSTSLELRWEDTNSNSDHRYYNITWYSIHGSLNELSFINGLRADVNNLTSNAQYTFAVIAFNVGVDAELPAVLTTETRK